MTLGMKCSVMIQLVCGSDARDATMHNSKFASQAKTKVELYKNLSGNSGVSNYAIGKDFIEIKFNENDNIYIYNYFLNGEKHIEKMKELAVKGEGLNTYISQTPEVKNHFISR